MHLTYPETPRMATGLLAVDSLTGGGIPAGSTFDLSGDDETQKELFAFKVISAAQKQAFSTAYVDTDGFAAESFYQPSQNSRFQFGALGLDPKKLKMYYCEKLDLELLAEALVPMLESEKMLLVLGDLATMVIANIPNPRNTMHSLHLAHSRVRTFLSRLALAARQSGSVLLLLNTQRVSQFSYIPPKSLIDDQELHLAFPTHCLSGICELKLHRLEKEKPENFSGAIIRAEMVYSRWARPGLRDQLYVDYLTGFGDIRTVIKVARDQDILQVKNDKWYYLENSLKFKPQAGLYALHRYLSKNSKARQEITQQIDWKKTPYEYTI